MGNDIEANPEQDFRIARRMLAVVAGVLVVGIPAEVAESSE